MNVIAYRCHHDFRTAQTTEMSGLLLKIPHGQVLTFYLFGSYALVQWADKSELSFSHFNNAFRNQLMSNRAIKLMLIIFGKVENWIEMPLL